jgi:CheY-like chemotaxis protein
MDVDMPVMNGYEATRRIREAGYQGPIVALTAHAMSQHVQESLAAGCNSHIAKPIDREQFLKTLSSLLASKALV